MDQEPEEITVTYPYSAAEHAQAIKEQPRVTWFVRAHVGLTLAMLVYFTMKVVGAAIEKNMPLSRLILPVVFILLPISLLCFLPLLLGRFEAFRYRRQTPDGTRETRRITSRGFAPSAESQLIPWGLVTRVRETRSSFLFADASSLTWVSLPKRVMSQTEIDRVRTILQKEFQSRPKELNLLRVP